MKNLKKQKKNNKNKYKKLLLAQAENKVKYNLNNHKMNQNKFNKYKKHNKHNPEINLLAHNNLLKCQKHYKISKPNPKTPLKI